MIYAFAEFTFDTDKHTLSRAGDGVAIEPQAFALLHFLLQHPQKLITRDALIDAIWDGRAVTDWAVSAAIKSLRRALEDGGPAPLIRTVHGKGIRLDTSVQTHAPGQGTTLMVLPFDLQGADPSQTYMADGLSDDVRTILAGANGLRVASRHASLSAGATDRADLTLQGTYGVSHVFEATLRIDGPQMRVNAQLRDVAAGQELWAKRFEDAGEGLFALQDRIVEQIRVALDLTFAPKRARPDPRAHDLCLRGRQAYFRYTPKYLADALGDFRKASDLDPTYAEALAYQSYCRCSLYVFGFPGADNSLDPALRLAEAATKADPASSVAQARLGWVLGFLGDTAKTVQAFDAAVASQPDNAEVLHGYGETLNRLGRPAEALALLDKAMRQEPFAPPSWDWARGHAHILLRQYDRALEHILPVVKHLPGLVPALVQLTRAYIEMNELEEARATVARLGKVAPAYGLANAARMFPYPEASDRERLSTALTQAGLK